MFYVSLSVEFLRFTVKPTIILYTAVRFGFLTESTFTQSRRCGWKPHLPRLIQFGVVKIRIRRYMGKYEWIGYIMRYIKGHIGRNLQTFQPSYLPSLPFLIPLRPVGFRLPIVE